LKQLFLVCTPKADNPELLKAQELGLKIYSYPNFIRTIQKIKHVLGGSHGKQRLLQ
jgi:UDP-N-acetylmuramate: L-alanyl-gamma-D-glutamyl-meso-diaminopimelate ligase